MIPLAISIPGNLGNIAGVSNDGVFAGLMTPAALSKLLIASHQFQALCYTDDGGTYTNETTDFASAGTDDVPLLPAVPAVDDAIYFGLGSKFNQVDIDISTSGVGTWTVVWQYWDGTEWANLAGVIDATIAFTAAPGISSVTFTQPTDWIQNTVDSLLGYWIRANVATYSAVTTQPLAGKGNAVTSSPQYTDATTDANDADAGDVDLLPVQPHLGDAVYFGSAAKFCKVKITISQARTGTATLVLEYWNGTSWAAVPIVDDDTAGFSASPGTYFIHFAPPTNWVANTVGNGPNGQAGFFVRMEITALTSATQQPQATQAWVYPLQTGSAGIPLNFTGNINKITANALTKSASNADSVFLLINKTKNTFVPFTWTKATALVSAAVALTFSTNDEILLVQVTEDGSTEFADASFYLAAT